MRKGERLDLIVKLLETESVWSQGQVVQRLREQGFEVTQASISRDLEELFVGKVNGRYVLPKRSGAGPELGEITFEMAGDSLIVGKCMSGMASALTVRIDAEGFAEVVGTIAGDDTIFIAVRNVEEQASALKKLKRLFGERDGTDRTK